MPWSDPHSGRVVLGATVEEACSGPRQLQDALASFAGGWGGGAVGWGGMGWGALVGRPAGRAGGRLGRQADRCIVWTARLPFALACRSLPTR